MPVVYQKMIYREDLRANKNVLYIFGDNKERRGFAGQAAEMRGESNAVGVITKNKPSSSPDSYLSDDDYMINISLISEDLKPVLNHLKRGGTVVIPIDGIGTGLANMKKSAPKTYDFLQLALSELSNI